MRKLTPLAQRPTLEESRIKIDDARKMSNTHGLHLSVNFSSQGWRQALDPLTKKKDENIGEQHMEMEN